MQGDRGFAKDKQPWFLDWTRRDIYVLIVLGVVPPVAYQTGNMTWLGIPWTVVALLGTATAFIVGFKNLQSYKVDCIALSAAGE
ncbi:MAG TPA: hypothetical protein VK878_02930 [Candidatus Deferrimicrobiaceae bacterium]|nr:hypothetical protein [Candidatus Deferrimicrobiaceae bacterium]